jgi:hypothetical protein
VENVPEAMAIVDEPAVVVHGERAATFDQRQAEDDVLRAAVQRGQRAVVPRSRRTVSRTTANPATPTT